MKKLSLVLLLFAVFSISLQAQWRGEKGKGPVVERTLDVPSFEGIKLTFSGNIYLRQGSTQSVKVEGQENIINLMSTEVKDGMWKVKFTKNVRNYDKLNVYVTVPSLKYVGVSGSGNIRSEGNFSNLGNLKVHISGSGDIKFEADAGNVEAHVSGSGDIKMRGSASDVDIKISGSGNVNLESVKARNCNIKISGSGDASVHASETLTVKVSGSGDVYYSGQPRIKSKISGSGDIESRSRSGS